MNCKKTALFLCVLLIISGCTNRTTEPIKSDESFKNLETTIPSTSVQTDPNTINYCDLTVDEIDQQYTLRRQPLTPQIRTYEMEDGYLLLTFKQRNIVTKAAVYDREWNLIRCENFTPIEFGSFRATDFLGEPYTKVVKAYGESFATGSANLGYRHLYITTDHRIISFALDGADNDSPVIFIEEVDFTINLPEAEYQSAWLTESATFSVSGYLSLYTYHLENLEGYFRSHKGEVWTSDDFDSTYKTRLFRKNNDTCYSIYETKEGGFFYVFWERTESGVWQIISPYYLGRTSPDPMLPDLELGEVAYIGSIDPWAEFKTEENGELCSYSIVQLGKLLRVSYDQLDDGTLIVRDKEIVDASSSGTRIGHIMEADYPTEWKTQAEKNTGDK